jgi:hypothetical protein
MARRALHIHIRPDHRRPTRLSNRRTDSASEKILSTSATSR